MLNNIDGKRHRTKVRAKRNFLRSATPTQICILGGGFGGLYTALSLHHLKRLKSQNCQITLVEHKDRFLFTPLLYELVTDELQRWEIAPSYQKLLANTNIQFCQNTIENLNLETRQVFLQGGKTLTYDYLVLAVGSETCLKGIPGATSWAIPFRTLADVQRLKEQLRFLEVSNQELIRVAVVGGGPNGVELACKLADRLGKRGRVRLIERGKEILKTFSPSIQAMAHRALKVRNVWVDLETNISAIAFDQITLVHENQAIALPANLVLWTAGTQSFEWVRNLTCQHNSIGQLLARPTLQLIDYPEVFALGDLAEIQDGRGRLVPATAQAAYQQADCTAWNLWASVTNRPLRSFRYLYLGEMLTLGINEAVVSSFGINLGGSLACLIRRLVYLQRLPTRRHRLAVFGHVIASWVLKWRRRGRQQLAKLVVKNSARRQRQISANYQRRSH